MHVPAIRRSWASVSSRSLSLGSNPFRWNWHYSISYVASREPYNYYTTSILPATMTNTRRALYYTTAHASFPEPLHYIVRRKMRTQMSRDAEKAWFGNKTNSGLMVEYREQRKELEWHIRLLSQGTAWPSTGHAQRSAEICHADASGRRESARLYSSLHWIPRNSVLNGQAWRMRRSIRTTYGKGLSTNYKPWFLKQSYSRFPTDTNPFWSYQPTKEYEPDVYNIYKADSAGVQSREREIQYIECCRHVLRQVLTITAILGLRNNRSSNVILICKPNYGK